MRRSSTGTSDPPCNLPLPMSSSPSIPAVAVEARQLVKRYGALAAVDGVSFQAMRGEVFGSYSHGMRQKIGLASLLIREPSVLLLDEPTNGLDPRSARLVKDLLEELAARGTTVLLSTHILEVAQALCRRVAIIDRGRIVAVGSMDELRVQTGSAGANLEDLFLKLTAGPESREMIERLLEGGS